MIKGKNIGAALLCAITLAGCGKVPDLTKKFKDNLDYTLDEYSVSAPTEYDNGDMNWKIHFTDKNGYEQLGVLRSNVYDDFRQGLYDSKEKMQISALFDFYESCIREIGQTELWKKILSEYFDMNYNRYSSTQKNDEITIHTTVGSAVSAITSDIAYEMITKEISPENGIKLSEEDLRSIVSKDYMMTVVLVVVENNIDPEPYIEKTKSALADFEKYDPVNYAFEVIDADKNIYFGKYIVFGEEKKHTDFFSEDILLFNISEPIARAWRYEDKE